MDIVEGKEAVVRVRLQCSRAEASWQSCRPRVIHGLQGGAVSYAAAVARAYGIRACVVTGALLPGISSCSSSAPACVCPVVCQRA